MLYVALALAVVILVLVWVGHKERTAHDKAVLDILASQEVERMELINQVKHPGYFKPTTDPLPAPEPTPEEVRRRQAYARVGTIGLVQTEDEG